MRKIARNKHRRARQAAAEVMGAILLIGATLAVGFAVWAYARGAASTAEKNFASEINSNVNCLNQNFVIVNAYFPTTTSVTLWFYNTGSASASLSNIIISNSNSSQVPYSGSLTGTLNPGVVQSFTLNTGTWKFNPNQLYNFKAEAMNTAMQCSIYSPTYPQITPSTL